MCASTGLRVLLSIVTTFRWILSKIGVRISFLQTDDAQRDFYVKAPYESADRSHYWLLLTSSYGLVNSNAKWQVQSDSLFVGIVLTQLPYIPTYLNFST